MDYRIRMKPLIIIFLFGILYFSNLNAKENSNIYVACVNGDNESCNKIGQNFIHKYSSIFETIQQFNCLHNRCEQSDPGSCIFIAAFYYQGKKISRNPELAARYYGIACELGSAGGCHYQAELVDAGIGDERDRDLATFIYKRSCERGESLHCKIVGSRYEHGISVKKSLVDALIYYYKGCSLLPASNSYIDDKLNYGCVDYDRLKKEIEKN